MSTKQFEWFPISTLNEASEDEQLRGLWFFEEDGVHFYCVCKGYWRVPSSITHWAYGDKPNKPKTTP